MTKNDIGIELKSFYGGVTELELRKDVSKETFFVEVASRED